MAEIEKILTLRVIQGPSEGNAYILKADSCSIGTARNCTLRVSGRHVSDVHAVLSKQADGNWVASNKSPNGSFVNQKRIDTQLLREGDVLQVGAETLIQLENAAKPEKKSKSSKKSESKSVGSGLLGKKPGLVVGIGVYLLILIAFGLYLSLGGDGAENKGLSRAEVVVALESTEKSLRDRWESLSVSESSETRYLNDRDEAHLYYAIISTSTSDVEREKAIKELLASLGDAFFRAWQLERQGNEAEAKRAYQQVVETAPELRLRTTWLAMGQLKRMQGSGDE